MLSHPLLYIVCLVGLTLLVAPSARQGSAAEPSVITGPAAVIDGDTIIIARVHVRLKGIAAPELHDPGGKQSADALRKMIAQNIVRCDLTGETNKERKVGYCSIGALDLNAAMVKSGNALSCPRYSDRYVGLEPSSGLVQQTRYRLPNYCIVNPGRPTRR